MKSKSFFDRRSLIMGTTTLIGLIIGWFTRQILLGVAIGLAAGAIITAWTPWFRGSNKRE